MSLNMPAITAKLKLYWPLPKSLRTGLLLSIGLAGYMSARCPVMHWHDFPGLGITLFLTIAGSTILNMWYDRDPQAVMDRMHRGPLAAGRVQPAEALRLGLTLSSLVVGFLFRENRAWEQVALGCSTVGLFLPYPLANGIGLLILLVLSFLQKRRRGPGLAS